MDELVRVLLLGSVTFAVAVAFAFAVAVSYKNSGVLAGWGLGPPEIYLQTMTVVSNHRYYVYLLLLLCCPLFNSLSA